MFFRFSVMFVLLSMLSCGIDGCFSSVVWLFYEGFVVSCLVWFIMLDSNMVWVIGLMLLGFGEIYVVFFYMLVVKLFWIFFLGVCDILIFMRIVFLWIMLVLMSFGDLVVLIMMLVCWVCLVRLWVLV